MAHTAAMCSDGQSNEPSGGAWTILQSSKVQPVQRVQFQHHGDGQLLRMTVDVQDLK